MSDLGEKKEALERAEIVFETTGVITASVYRVSPEQKEKLDRLAEEKIKKAREEAITQIRERYEQRVREIRQQQPEAGGEGGISPSKE